MEAVKKLLEIYSAYTNEVNFLAWALFVVCVSGVLIAYRIRGRRLRQTMKEWENLFMDMDDRVRKLQVELVEVRTALIQAKTEAFQANVDSAVLKERNAELTREVEQLRRRIEELEAREKQLIQQINEKD